MAEELDAHFEGEVVAIRVKVSLGCEQTLDFLEFKSMVDRSFLKLFSVQHAFKTLAKLVTELTNTCFVAVR